MSGGEPDMPTQQAAAPVLPFAYRVVRFLCNLFLSTEFRHIEVSGTERVPKDVPLLLVANHFSSLVDPMALLHASPRPISILARAPIFGMPVLGLIVRSLRAVPVYRPQDVEENRGRTTTANVEMFKACRERLGEGGAIALFPEGLSQPGPKLFPVRTGAARIALDTKESVTILPAGLLYGPSRGGRRATLLILFGRPFPVEHVESGARPRETVRRLTRHIEGAIRDLLVEVPSQTDLRLLQALRTVSEQEEGVAPPRTLAEAYDRDRKLARGFARLQAVDAPAAESLRHDTDAYVQALGAARLRPEDLGEKYSRGRVLRFLFLDVPAFLIGLPLGIASAVVTWPIRKIGDVLALRIAGGRQDMRALCRMFGGAWFLLLAMLVGGTLAAIAWGGWAGLAVVLVLPCLLFFHVFWRDHQRDLSARIHAFLLLAGAPLRTNLEAHRRRLYAALQQARASITPPEQPD